MSSTPLTLAETASVFGEMLTFRALLQFADPKQRRIMLAAKVEDMLNTVVRQVAFYHFETLVHDERRSGELVPDRIGERGCRCKRRAWGRRSSSHRNTPCSGHIYRISSTHRSMSMPMRSAITW